MSNQELKFYFIYKILKYDFSLEFVGRDRCIRNVYVFINIVGCINSDFTNLK